MDTCPCPLCGKSLTEIENIKTRFERNEELTIESKNLDFSPIYKVFARYACLSCGTLYKLNLDKTFKFTNLPETLTIPEGRLRAISKNPESSLLTV